MDKWLILNRIINVWQKYLLPFNCVQTIAILNSEEIKNKITDKLFAYKLYLCENKWLM